MVKLKSCNLGVNHVYLKFYLFLEKYVRIINLCLSQSLFFAVAQMLTEKPYCLFVEGTMVMGLVYKILYCWL